MTHQELDPSAGYASFLFAGVDISFLIAVRIYSKLPAAVHAFKTLNLVGSTYHLNNILVRFHYWIRRGDLFSY